MSFVDKVWHWLGGSEMVEEEYIELPIPADQKTNSKGNLVSLQTAKTIKVVVCEPSTFDESQSIADNLKNRRQVILNLDSCQPDVARRIIDFISGITYALDGHTQQLGDHIFMFAPSNFEISKDPRLILKNSYTFSRSTNYQE